MFEDFGDEVTYDVIFRKGNKVNKYVYDMKNLFNNGFPFLKKTKDIFEMAARDKIIKEFIQDYKKTWIMIFDRDLIIAMASFEEDRLYEDINFYVGNVVVNPKYRNKGLMSFMITKIKERYQNGLWLEVNTDNPAFKKYSKYGFNIYKYIDQKDKDDDDVFEEGDYGKRVIMILR